jgi:hypothetical protein
MQGNAMSWSAEDPTQPSPNVAGAPAFFPVEFEAPAAPPMAHQQPARDTPPPATTVDMGGGGGGWQPNNGLHSREVSAADISYGAVQQQPGGDASGGAGGNGAAARFGDPADDLPLLEELGIFPAHIFAKSQAVLHPMRHMNDDVVEDSDLAGPLCFCVILAFLLTLQGKMHFGAIYGLSVLGALFAQGLLTLMSDTTVRLQLVISSLGYCLLPNLILAVVSTLHLWVVGTAVGIMLPLSLLTVAWSAWCCTKMFTQAFVLDQQRFLVLYPVTLFYAVFAAITIF